MASDLIRVQGERGVTRSATIQLDTILAFVKKRCHPSARPTCKEVCLAHLVEGSPGEVILTRPITGKFEEDEEPEDVAKECYDLALDDAKTFERTQKYAVVAYDSSKVVIARHTFIVIPAPGSGSLSGAESEPATMQGLQAQHMRFTQGVIHMAFTSTQANNDRLQDENDRLRERLNHLEDKHFGVLTAMEDLKDRKAERDVLLAEKKAEADRVERAWKTVEKLFPALAEKYGFDLADAAGNPAAAILGKLRPEQRAKMLAVLDEEQLADFAKLFGFKEGTS